MSHEIERTMFLRRSLQIDGVDQSRRSSPRRCPLSLGGDVASDRRAMLTLKAPGKQWRQKVFDRDDMLEGWNVAWEHGLWAVPWSRALEGLTARHAIWKPAPGRHSVWQIVHHYHLFHDNYHIGQIMQLRALQGFVPIE